MRISSALGDFKMNINIGIPIAIKLSSLTKKENIGSGTRIQRNSTSAWMVDLCLQIRHPVKSISKSRTLPTNDAGPLQLDLCSVAGSLNLICFAGFTVRRQST